MISLEIYVNAFRWLHCSLLCTQ